jgi:hypothetical protein
VSDDLRHDTGERITSYLAQAFVKAGDGMDEETARKWAEALVTLHNREVVKPLAEENLRLKKILSDTLVNGLGRNTHICWSDDLEENNGVITLTDDDNGRIYVRTC